MNRSGTPVLTLDTHPDTTARNLSTDGTLDTPVLGYSSRHGQQKLEYGGYGCHQIEVTLVFMRRKFIVKKSEVMVGLCPNWVATGGCERIQYQLCIMVVEK